jgi:hypothetical protein
MGLFLGKEHWIRDTPMCYQHSIRVRGVRGVMGRAACYRMRYMGNVWRYDVYYMLKLREGVLIILRNGV